MQIQVQVQRRKVLEHPEQKKKKSECVSKGLIHTGYVSVQVSACCDPSDDAVLVQFHGGMTHNASGVNRAVRTNGTTRA